MRNKARVEASIANAYLVEEASNFCSYYFEDHIHTKQRSIPRNFMGRDDNVNSDNPELLSIFKYAGRPFGKKSSRFLESNEYDAAHLYVLHNCAEVANTYIKLFIDDLRARYIRISAAEINRRLEVEFPSWFKSYVSIRMFNSLQRYKLEFYFCK